MDNKNIIITDIIRFKSILKQRQYYEKMLFDFINNKQMESILKITNMSNNPIIHDINSFKKDKNNNINLIFNFLDSELEKICDHEWETDYIDFMVNGEEETRKIKYCKKCELEFNIN